MRYCLIIAVLIILSLPSFAQDEPLHPTQVPEPKEPQPEQVETKDEQKPEIPLSERIFFGGSFGLQFGNLTYINLSPLVGYKLTPRFSVAAGVIYQYTNDQYYDYSYSTYGFRTIGIAKIFGPVFAQVEYEYLNYESINIYAEELRRDYHSVLAGGGLAQPLSRNVYLTAIVLYNFTYEEVYNYSIPYTSPWVFRIGVSAGF